MGKLQKYLSSESFRNQSQIISPTEGQYAIARALKMFNASVKKQQKPIPHGIKQILQTLYSSRFLQNSKSDNQRISQFKEEWENTKRGSGEINYSYFFHQHLWYAVYNFILVILMIGLIWILSIFRVFKNENNIPIFVFFCLIEVLYLFLKFTYAMCYKFKKQNLEQVSLKFKNIIWEYLENAFCMIYSMLGILNIINSPENSQFLVLDIFAIGILCFRLEKINNDIKLIQFSSQIKIYLNLASLIGYLLLTIHLFAIIMYFASNYSEQHYLSNLEDLQYKTWIEIYIYSIYFTGTTILTVGYGDLLPHNMFEILIVIVMQISGTVITVFLNGQVGNILCKLRRQKQILQNDISVLERLKSNFRLSSDTTKKIRQYLIINNRSDEEKNIEEQNSLLNKISSNLRQQAVITNHISMVKQSIFLVYNFSTKTQLDISNRLIRQIYSPNQIISQIMGKQKLYLICKGQIIIHVSSNYKNQPTSKKIVKKLIRSKNQQSGENCFGYIQFITGKPNRLKTISKDFSTCHFIYKEDFMDMIKCDNIDFQRYHQLREIYLNSTVSEQYQAPQFYSTRNHYLPSIQQNISEYLKQKHRSKRRSMIRRDRYQKLIFQTIEIEGMILSSQNELDSQDEHMFAQDGNLSLRRNQVLTNNEREEKYKALSINVRPQTSQAINLIVQRSYARRHRRVNNKQEQVKERQFVEQFQSARVWQGFFVNNNLDIVIKRANHRPKVVSIITNLLNQVNNLQLFQENTKRQDQHEKVNTSKISQQILKRYRNHNNLFERM